MHTTHTQLYYCMYNFYINVVQSVLIGLVKRQEGQQQAKLKKKIAQMLVAATRTIALILDS